MSKRRRGRKPAKSRKERRGINAPIQTDQRISGNGPRDGSASILERFNRAASLVAAVVTVLNYGGPRIVKLCVWIIKHLPCRQSGIIRFIFPRPAVHLAGRSYF